MENEELMELLSARQYAYSVFQRVLGDVPTAELLDAIDADLLRTAFEIVGVAADDGSVDAFIDAISPACDGIEALASQYARIFVGPGDLPAPPWESVWRDHRRMLMTPTTLSVRDAYRAQGFIPERYPHVPDDHVALELDFLAALSTDALEACHRGDEAEALRLRDAGTRFAAEHLALWAGDFARAVSEKADSPFYTVVTMALAAFVSADAGV